MNASPPRQKIIVQIVQHLVPGGIESMALEMTRKAPANTQVHIISLEGQKDAAIQAWPRLTELAERLHFLEKAPGLSPVALMRLLFTLKRLRPDAVHTHHIGPMLYGGVAARILGIRCIVHTEHDAWHLTNPANRKIVSRCAEWLRPIMVADAKLVADGMRRALPNVNPFIIPNGIDTERFTPASVPAPARKTLGLPEHCFLVGCAARLEAVKGVDIAIRALALLPEDVHLAIAGQGSERSALELLATQLGIRHRVHFQGLVSDMRTFYRALDLFCLPSRNEGMPLSPLEAQACGIRALVTRVGGAEESVCPETGRLVPAENPEAMAQAIREIIQSGASCSPRDFVVKHHGLDAMISQYHTLMTVAS